MNDPTRAVPDRKERAKVTNVLDRRRQIRRSTPVVTSSRTSTYYQADHRTHPPTHRPTGLVTLATTPPTPRHQHHARASHYRRQQLNSHDHDLRLEY
jgi:hypothetical protein